VQHNLRVHSFQRYCDCRHADIFIASVNPPPILAMSNAVLNPGNLGALMPPPQLPSPCFNFTPAHQPISPGHPQSLPPPLPRALSLAGPAVHIPSAWNQTPQLARPAAPGCVNTLPPNSTSYSSQHLQYAAQHERWARMAYRPPPAETICLEITAMFETAGKRKNARTNIIGVSVL